MEPSPPATAKRPAPRSGDLILPQTKRSDKSPKKAAKKAIFKQTRLRGYIGLFILTFLALSPLLSNPTLWSEFDIAKRSPFPEMTRWTQAWSLESIRNHDPFSLTTYFIERSLPQEIQATFHRVLNICLHFLAAVLLVKTLEARRIRGAYFAGLLFALHPSAVETIFWPGYRQEMVGLCLIALALIYGFKVPTQRNITISFLLTCVACIAHPAALAIPVILGLNILSKNRYFQAKDYNPILPVTCACLFLAAWILGASNPWTQQANGGSTRQLTTEVGNNLHFHLTQSFAPGKLELFHPFLYDEKNGLIQQISPEPFLLFAPLIVVALIKFKRTWARAFLACFGTYVALLVYSVFQRGSFLDGSPAYENFAHYTALSALLSFLTLGSYLLANRIGSLAILCWRVAFVCILTLQFSSTVYFAYGLRSDRIMWADLSATWPKQSLTKMALFETMSEQELKSIPTESRISMLLDILEAYPEMTEQRVTLARVYAEFGQPSNALREYKQILRNTEPSNEFLEEAAVFFESRGLSWEATNARKRKTASTSL